MFCRSVKIAIVSLVLLMAVNLSAEEKKFWIVNFGGTVEFPVEGWGNSGKYDDIFKWGLDKKIYLLADRNPVSDNVAAFVLKNGASIKISKLKQKRHYTAWFDFVNFKGSDKSKINSRLEIFADNRKIKELVWSKIPSDGYFPVELPDDLTFKGSVVLSLKEFSPSGGLWGVWDVIIAENGEFPDEIAIKESEKIPDIKEAKQASPERKKQLKKEAKTAAKTPEKQIKKDSDAPVGGDKEVESSPTKKGVAEEILKNGEKMQKNQPILKGDVVEPILPREPDLPEVK